MISELKKELNWEIKEKKVFQGDVIGFDEITTHKAITRGDSGSTLSVMKKSYSPMSNSEFMDVVAKMQEISGFKLAGFTEIKGGKKVIGFLENDIVDLFVGGKKIKDYFLLGNSFDGSTSFFTGTSTVLIRCQNQFSQIDILQKIRHTGSISTKLEEYYIYLDSYFAKRKKLYETFEKMGDLSFSEELRERMIKFVLSAEEKDGKKISAQKQNQIDALRECVLSEMADLGSNLFGAFNGVTKYTTHELKVKSPSFGNLFGIQSTINDKAFDFASNLLTLS